MICKKCKEEKSDDGFVYCPECRLANRKRNRSDYIFYKTQCICTYCRKQRAVKGHIACQSCTESRRVRCKQWRDAKKKRG